MFGKNLKKIRSVHGLSQQQFAEMFDLKRATLGAYEEGRSNPKMDTVIKIANHFSIDIEDLLTKELTVNRLLKFNETITTSPAAPPKQTFEGIPCVTEDCRKVFLNSLVSNTPITMPNIFLPNVTLENKTAFVVDDISMSGAAPSFLPKDTIIGENIPLNQIETASGKIVVVATPGQLLFRKLTYKGATVVLSANQQGVEVVELPVTDITGVWQIVHIFHYTIPGENEVEKRLAMLENTIAALSRKV